MSQLRPGSTIQVRRAKTHKADLIYPMTVELDDGDRITVIGPYSGAVALDLGYVIFEPSDIFKEHFWRTRWYSIAAVHDRDLQPKGWYCDVARPALVADGEILSADLELDVWQAAKAEPPLTLDEDEFSARQLLDTDPIAHDSALAALRDLRAAARTRFVSLLGSER